MMKSRQFCRGARIGDQEPTQRVSPDYVESDGLDTAAICKTGHINLDEWQRTVLCDWMGRSASGMWASSTCGGSAPRQNGKSLLVQVRAEGGMLLFGEEIIYTAHLQKTATETFEEMRDFFESPKLAKQVKEIKTAIGREMIILKNGARIKFLARTRNGGRGQHGDLLIFDEAQELDETSQASVLPAISASDNPQTLYVGTPPDPTVTGTVFRAIRDKALAKETSRTSWFEFSVDDMEHVDNTELWEKTNPALGIRILPETIQSEFEQMDADTFARERLGWWSPVVHHEEQVALDQDAWEKCKSNTAKPEGKTAYGVKFSADGSEVVLCGAVIPDGGKARITMIERKPTGHGTRWLSDWLNERYSKASCVVIDGRNGVDVVVDRITDTWRIKGSVVRPSARDVIAAAGLIETEINENTVTWFAEQEALDESVRTSIRRSIGGGWGFGGADSAPIEACSLALWGARTSKRNPAKKMRVG